jgi:glutathione S-transferase
MVLAHETGQVDRIEKLAAAANPVNRDASVVAMNPTGKVPTLVLDDGTTLFDSRVICQYLDAQHDGKRLYGADDKARWPILRMEAIADGLLDAALLARYETFMRPEEKRWDDWTRGQMDKISSSLTALEQSVSGRTDLDAGLIAAGCALGYLDLRFPDIGWRDAHPALAKWYETFSKRPSMQATVPVG